LKEATITEFGPQKLTKNGCTSVDLNKKVLYCGLLYCILCGRKLKELYVRWHPIWNERAAAMAYLKP